MVGEIIKAEAFLTAIEMARPFSLGFGTLSTLPRVFLRLEAESRGGSVVGYGEAAIDFPFAHYDAWDILWALRGVDLAGRDVEHRSRLLNDSDIRERLLRFPAAFTALNMALDDLLGRHLHQPLADFYQRQRGGGQALASLPFFATEADCLAELERRLRQGFIVKLKGGQGIESDARVLAAACQYLAEQGSSCAIDFNACYQPDEFQSLVDRLGEGGFPWSVVLFLEQPTVHEAGIAALSQARELLRHRGVSTPVMADESFVSKEDARQCSSDGLLLNYKTQKIGGIVVAAEIEAELEPCVLPSMVGGTFPTAIGRVYDQHAATVLRTASLPSPAWVPSTTYLAGDKHLIHESFPGPSDGQYPPFSGPGLGVTVNEAAVAAWRIHDPAAEYRAIRNDREADHLRVQLRSGASYRASYEQLTGRSVDWNLGDS